MKNINKIFYVYFFVLSPWYLVCLLRLEYISFWTGHIPSTQYGQIWLAACIGQSRAFGKSRKGVISKVLLTRDIPANILICFCQPFLPMPAFWWYWCYTWLRLYARARFAVCYVVGFKSTVGLRAAGLLERVPECEAIIDLALAPLMPVQSCLAVWTSLQLYGCLFSLLWRGGVETHDLWFILRSVFESESALTKVQWRALSHGI